MKQTLIIGLSLLAIAAGCSKKTTAPVPEEITAAQYLAQGWTSFNAGSYSAAMSDFNNAIAKDAALADAHNGKGWCQGILGSPAAALATYRTGLSHSGSNNEIKSGMAFSYSTLDSSAQAINLALEVHNTDSLWQFPHTYRASRDNQLNYREIRLLLCQNYFKRAIFDSSYLWVQKLPTGLCLDSASLTTPDGQAALQAEIERLGTQF